MIWKRMKNIEWNGRKIIRKRWRNIQEQKTVINRQYNDRKRRNLFIFLTQDYSIKCLTYSEPPWALTVRLYWKIRFVLHSVREVYIHSESIDDTWWMLFSKHREAILPNCSGSTKNCLQTLILMFPIFDKTSVSLDVYDLEISFSKLNIYLTIEEQEIIKGSYMWQRVDKNN